MKILVTGATGFIGRALCARLAEKEAVRLTGTARSPNCGDGIVPIAARQLGADTDWQDLVEAVDVVVHTAARVHATRDAGNLAEFRRVNVDGTLNLAAQAAARGVRRFVFLSSVKVNGDCTPPGHAFTADDPPAPVDAYAISKHEAETGLSRLAKEHGMDCVTIRAPLVYGPGVKANFLDLMRWVHKGYPLPFAGLENARSLIGLDNLIDLISICCTHPRAANETFMAADERDVSIAELITSIAAALGQPPRLFALPRELLLALAAIAGKRSEARKLLGNLQVDTRKTCELLSWKPAMAMDRQLKATARYFLEVQR